MSNERVQQGGFWQPAKTQYSTNTQQLLKTMMQESHLTNLQMRKVDETMKNGSTLPDRLPPTSSAKSKNRTLTPKQTPKVLNPRNYSGGMRKKDQIEASGAYSRPMYRPSGPPPKSVEVEKRRLGNLMAYGEECNPEDKKRQMRPVAPPEPEPEKDRFDELADEVSERRKFLNDMESLGQGKQYRAKIESEISQMIREMELIDKKRNSELQQMMAE